MEISQIRNFFQGDERIKDPMFTVMEWCGENFPLRPVAVVLNTVLKQIQLLTHGGVVLRVVDLSTESCKLTIYIISDEPYMLIKSLPDYDLMLKFDSHYLRENFHTSLERFIENVNLERQVINNLPLEVVTKICITKQDRQKKLEILFRVVLAQTFKLEHSGDDFFEVNSKMAKTLLNTKLTLSEFADVLRMRLDDEFVLMIFQLINKNKNEFISFREFLNLLIIFAEGDENQKAKLLFDMYDIYALQSLTLQEFIIMIKSFLETVEEKIEPEELQKTLQNMLESAGLHNKIGLTFNDIKHIIVELTQTNFSFDRKIIVGQKSFAVNNIRDAIERIYEYCDSKIKKVSFLPRNLGNPVDIPTAESYTAPTSKIVIKDNVTVNPLRLTQVEISVIKAENLPSSVTMLEFKKPDNFEYKSGQWVRIACLGLNATEFHPFTLTSSPNEANLTLHLRSMDPWARNIRSLCDNSKISEQALPKFHLDGPYGEEHQDWSQFDVAVLIGGGIGVAPFVSILKDIVFRENMKHKGRRKKVYFMWVSKAQKQFEWLVDILRELEKLDKHKVVSNHIFITEGYQKFDLRTILLYIFERHCLRKSDKSFFTNLKTELHFRRPEFGSFFKRILALHPDVRTVGVFSCGPPQMTTSIESACDDINRISVDGPIFFTERLGLC